MKKNKFNLRSFFRAFGFLLIVFLAFATVESRALKLSVAKAKGVNEFAQTSSPKKKKTKRKEKAKQKMTESKTSFVPPSNWGAIGIGLVVGENDAKIEYDCADGEIGQKLSLDKDGNFSADGFHIQQRGGPVRLDSPPERKPAHYEGKVSGDTMTLKVTLAESRETIGEFVLQRDKAARIRRCL